MPEKSIIQVCGKDHVLYRLNSLVVGSGVAGLNAADSLHSLGVEDVAILTEGIDSGTSRNTGSDKQTYYKLSSSGAGPDSVREMAATLFAGGSMHGDIALCEAALSSRCFYKLVELGVPFPHNKYGEYVGYKTDHDPRQRATSTGPLTSKFMTERLEAAVKSKRISIFDRFLAVAILTDKERTAACGVAALDLDRLSDPDRGLTFFNCTNIVFATGGPAGIYRTSVYPESQFGSLGIALAAGAKGVNLSESQFGIASLKFRWNLSGTYQQVIPRYFSVDKDGNDPREFLREGFPDEGKMLDAIFLKGYQWPFDPRKISGYGSSLVDLLVYRETEIKGRRVFLDYTNNPGCKPLDFSLFSPETLGYLEKSGADRGSPIERLEKMNAPAIELYRSHGIDLASEPLEISVCAQHINGGLYGNHWWESNLAHFFPVGECNGTFGVYRPGGSALNSTQVGSLRAGQYISQNYRQAPPKTEDFMKAAGGAIEMIFAKAYTALEDSSRNRPLDISGKLDSLRTRMSKCGAYIRSKDEILAAIGDNRSDFTKLKNCTISGHDSLPAYFRYRDALCTEYAILQTIRAHIDEGGVSRGSYLVLDLNGELPAAGFDEAFRARFGDDKLNESVREIRLDVTDSEIAHEIETAPVRPIPEAGEWFENVWKEFREGKVFE